MKRFTFIMLIAFCNICNAQDVQFNGTMSRQQLEAYLSRALVTEFDSLHRGIKAYNDLIDFAARCDARFLCTCYGIGYGSELAINTGFFDTVANTIIDINSAYAKKDLLPPIVGAAIWEKITHDINNLWIPSEVASLYHVGKRKFIFDSVKYVNDTNTLIATPDISRKETQMYFYFLATRFINAGVEAIHLGIIGNEDKNDQDHVLTWNLLTNIRKYAATKNRGVVLLNADEYGIHLKNTDTLLFDFNTNPTRVSGYKTGYDSTWASMWDYFESPYGGPGRLTYNDCSPYGKMEGGTTYFGWHADTLCYLLALDNTLTSNCNCLYNTGCWTVYGFDEISWFVLQAEDYRNQWLCYANEQVKKLDRNAFFAMPGRTLFTRRWIFYSAINGYGYNQEDAIINIWNGLVHDCDPNNVINLEEKWRNGTTDNITLVIYPNPIEKLANIIYTSANGSEVTIKITDVLGKIVYQIYTATNNGIIKWNTTDVPNGIYFCSAITDNGSVANFKIDIRN